MTPDGVKNEVSRQREESVGKTGRYRQPSNAVVERKPNKQACKKEVKKCLAEPSPGDNKKQQRPRSQTPNEATMVFYFRVLPSPRSHL